MVRCLRHSNWLAGHKGGDCVFVDEFRLPVSNEQRGIAVEPCHVALELNPIRQIDRDRDFVLAQVIQERVLECLGRSRAIVHLPGITPMLPKPLFSAHRPTQDHSLESVP